MIDIVGQRSLHPFEALKQIRVACRHDATERQKGVKPLQLGDSERGREIVETVVVAEPNVLEPAAGVRATLVGEALEQAPILFRRDRDRTTLPGRHLLVGVEGEDRPMIEGAERTAPVLGAERLTGILDEGERVPRGDLAERSELAGIAEDIDGDNGLRARSDCRLDGRRVQVQGVRIDVHEDRPRTFVEDAVRRSDKRERRRDRLVPGAETRSPDAEVESSRAARHRDNARRADALRECLLEAIDHGAEREPPGAQHLEDELLLPLSEQGLGERDGPCRLHDRGACLKKGARGGNMVSPALELLLPLSEQGPGQWNAARQRPGTAEDFGTYSSHWE